MTRRVPGTVAAGPLARQIVAAALGLVALLVLLGLSTDVGVTRACVGALLGVLLGALLLRAAVRDDATTLGPGGAVTLARGVLVVGVATLTGLGGAPTPAAVPATVAFTVLTGLALALDAVDGPVARRTGTATALGARFDMETDALLLLVLSVHVAWFSEPWVLALGLLRYVFVATKRMMPWLDGELPVRRSAKVVAALQGVVLVAASALLPVLPRDVVLVAIAVALVALVWSFAVSVVWLWRAADEHPVRWRAAGGALLTSVAAVLLFWPLVMPNDLLSLVPESAVRLPLELVVGAAAAAVLPPAIRRPLAWVAGLAVAVLGLLKILDLGFRFSLARPFDPVLDWVLLGNAQEFLTGTVGEAGAVAAAIVAVLLLIVLLVGTAAGAGRLARIAARHRGVTLATAGLLGAVWMLMYGLVGGQLVPRVPVAAADGVAAVRDRSEQIPRAIRDQRAFAAEARVDRFRGAPPQSLLGALRGKDVVFVVVESYGRVALDDPEMAPRIDPLLADGDRRLAATGIGSRSGFLTSPIAGGGSWLAHATLYSGLWIDNQRRHRDLVSSDRLTLTRAFRDAGWDTAAVVPGTTRAWPEASFYGYDRVHGSDGIGYRGPPFSWSPAPDQFAFSALQRLERDRAGRPPLMAEVALTSSHAPWTPVPSMLPWEAVGDGSVYGPQANGQTSYESIWSGDPATIRGHYLHATEYSLQATLAWLERYADANTVVVMLGDHQPAPMVTGPDARHDVPISVLAKDPAVLDRVARWGWTPGLRPAPAAPVWPMDDFRDRFLDTFSR